MVSSIEFRRPGVVVQEAPLPRDTGGIASSLARAVIIGVLDRGPLGPVPVSSWSQFQSIYGSWSLNARSNRTVDAAYSYFSNAAGPASSLVVVRTPATDAVSSSVTITEEGAEDFATITALSPGSWGDSLRVTIKISDEVAGAQAFSDAFSSAFSGSTGPRGALFDLYVRLLDENGNDLVSPERFYGVSTSPLDRTYFASIINTSSRLITVSHDSEAAAAGYVPKEVTDEDLTGGSDGTGEIALGAALDSLDTVESPLVIYHASSDSTDAPVATDVAEVVAYAQRRGDSFVIVDTSRLEGATASAVIDEVAAITTKSAFAAAFYPWIEVNDPLRGPTNVRKVIPPGGSVLGAFASNDAQFGPWRTPAGTRLALRNAVAVDQLLSESILAELNSSRTPVNALRLVSGAGVCIMGARTLDPTNADRYIAIRRSLSYITANLKRIAESALFEPNGPDLWERLTIQMTDWLGRYYQQGALRGAREPEAFQVTINDTNNTASTIAAGEVHVEVGVAVEFPAEFVIIKLTQYQGSVRS